MINKNNKNFQITLDPDSSTILETLAARFKTSKSIIIRNALKVYASKKNHSIRLNYSTFLEVEQTEQISSSKNGTVSIEETRGLTWEEIQNELKIPEEKKDDDELPF